VVVIVAHRRSDPSPASGPTAGSRGPRTCRSAEVLGAFQRAGVQLAVSSTGQPGP